MTRDTVIRAEGLGKMYVIGHKAERQERYLALRDVLARSAGSLYRKGRDLLHGRPLVDGDALEEFWALRDVNFEIGRGEVVGIIGRNGAGKSTLLKIMSRITEPSAGRVSIRGRVSSLLEVGTGFHPELTGRENIYLNGAILGMTRAEISRKFDEIVAFAEIERHLDTPVKRYSSGMYVRLAFAVAAHLDSDVLIVDEVLAVGDVGFQRKCLGAMGDISDRGRTILFVSHDMRRVTSLCERAILLDSGKVKCDAAAHAVAEVYSAAVGTTTAMLGDRKDRTGAGEARFTAIDLHKDGESTRTVQPGDEISIRVGVDVRRPLDGLVLHVAIATLSGVTIHEFYSDDGDLEWEARVGAHEFKINLEPIRLYPGDYAIDLWLGDRFRSRVDYVTDATRFQVVDFGGWGRTRSLDKPIGLVSHPARWERS